MRLHENPDGYLLAHGFSMNRHYCNTQIGFCEKVHRHCARLRAGIGRLQARQLFFREASGPIFSRGIHHTGHAFCTALPAAAPSRGVAFHTAAVCRDPAAGGNAACAFKNSSLTCACFTHTFKHCGFSQSESCSDLPSFTAKPL